MLSFTGEMNKGYLGKVFFLTLFLPVISLAVLAQFHDGTFADESSANIFSSIIALICWAVAGRSLCVKIFGKHFFWLLTILILVKIIANFFHFYYIFAPLAEIDSSGSLSHANYTGDLSVIYNSGMLFIQAYDEGGWFYAIFGDYYRGMNNPGVTVLYGALFNIFGAYGTVAVSWSVIYSAFTSLLIGLIGLVQNLPVKLCRTAMLLVFFMPGYFIYPPLYRDNFIIFLLVLSVYTVILISQGKKFLPGIAIVLESILLFSLRRVYLIIPPIFCIIAVYSNSKSRDRLMKYSIILCIVLLIAMLAEWNYVSFYLVSIFDRFGGGLASEQTNFSILMPFKSLGAIFFYPVAAIFSLLAPMPWWQSVSPSILAYQVFFYLQTWFFWTIIIALIYSWKLRLITSGGKFLITIWLTMFFLAVFGSLNLAAGYIQIATPLLILPCVEFLHNNKIKCILYSFSIIFIVHLLLLIKLLYSF